MTLTIIFIDITLINLVGTFALWLLNMILVTNGHYELQNIFNKLINWV